jgi:hypothetical protein
MAWYRTGTVSVTNGSTAVTGSGTNFVAGAQVGEGFAAPDGRLYEIVTIVSATSLTIGKAYLGSTQTGQTYEIVPTQSLVADLAGQVSTLISDFQSVADEAGEGKFDYGTAASPGITFTLDQDTGFFHDTNNEIGVSAGGTKVAEFNSGGLSFSSGKGVAGDTDFSGQITLSRPLSTVISRTDNTGLTQVNGGIDAAQGANFSLYGSSNASLPNWTVLEGDTMLFRPVDNSPEFMSFIDGTGAVFNETGADLDFRIESDTTTHAFFLRGSDGFTGIGTSTPRSQVHIYGAGQTTANLADAGDMGGILRVSGSGSAANTGGGIIFANLQSDDTQTAGMAAIKSLLQDGSNNTTGSLAFSLRAVNTDTALTERMRITSSGSVGIGTDSPTAKLDVNGSLSVSGGANFAAAANISGVVSVTAGTTENASINVGLGRTGDGNSFVDLISDATYTDFGARFIRTPGVNGTTNIQTRGTGSLTLLTQEAAPITMITSNTERMRITEAGQAIIPAGVTLGTAAGVYNAANTLDDYEEGTWTPEFTPATGAFGSIGYLFNTGTYTKVGRLVTVTGRIQLSGTPPTIGTAGGSCYLSGFPFIVATGQNFYGAISFTYITGWGNSFAPNSAFISPATSLAALMKRPVPDNNELIFSPADFISGGANSGFMFTATYFTT